MNEEILVNFVGIFAILFLLIYNCLKLLLIIGIFYMFLELLDFYKKYKDKKNGGTKNE